LSPGIAPLLAADGIEKSGSCLSLQIEMAANIVLLLADFSGRCWM
jgi:hypothetical protein